MSTFPEILVMYTPLVQFFMLYALLYRHEPSRLAHPLKEKTGMKAWAEALVQVGLVKQGVEGPSDTRTRKFVLELILPTALLAALCPELFLPVTLSLVPALTGLKGLVLFLLQFIPASYFLALLRRNYLGPLPIHRNRTTLPLPRMSSMIRCLGEKESEAV
ncbi:MAG: hypothetical protein ABSB26_03735 [Nitrososphaerales archaeon]